MKTETLTDAWKVKQLPHAINIIDDNGRYIAELRTHFLGEPTGYPQDKAKQTAELIVTAVNACKEINPDNPLSVAKNISELVKFTEHFAAYLKGENPMPQSILLKFVEKTLSEIKKQNSSNENS